MQFVLEFDNITKEYRSFASKRRLRALDSFSLAVEAGEIFGFLGPNGAGKSTAIHLAMGFMRPTSGSGRMLRKPFGHAGTAVAWAFSPRTSPSTTAVLNG
jgi:ABC-2 type transport system ATP-binding protein